MTSDRSRVAEWAALLGDRVPSEYDEGDAGRQGRE